MVERVRPGVLVVDGDAGKRGRIAALLGEAGIVATGVADGDAARAALSRTRFDLAVVGRLIGAADGLALSVWLGTRALDMGPLDDDEPRRFLSRVRDGLLDAEKFEGDGDEAELCIAAAKLACLDKRRGAARAAGESDLVDALARDIADTAALRRRLH